MRDDGGGKTPSWVSAWSDDDLRERFTPGTFERGRVYARAGAVRTVHAGGEGNVLLAQVDGNRRQPYQTLVTGPSARQSGIGGRCSCPMAVDCKHVVAVLLTARDRSAAIAAPFGPAPPSPEPVEQPVGQPAWVELLTGVMAPAEPEVHATLALQLELIPDSRSQHPRVRLRPLTRGKTGWIKTGASWRELEHRAYYGSNPIGPEQRAWASETLAIARSQQSSYYGTYADAPVHLDDLGPAVWRLMAAAQRCGFVLLGPGGAEVSLSHEPASATLDVRRDADGEIVLNAALQLPDGETLPRQAWLLGEPAHGAIVSSETLMHLIPFASPLDPPLRRLVTRGEIPVPEADLPRFLTEFYPALRRRLTVASGDHTVELPTVEPPRLGVQVRFEPGHDATIETAFVYRVGDSVRRVPIDEAATDPGRDFAAERALLRRHDNLAKLPGVRVHGLQTAELAEQILPELSLDDTVELVVEGEPASYAEAAEAPLVSVAIRDGKDDPDWFDLAVDVSVGGENVPFPPLFTALSLGEDRLLLDSGTWFRLDHPALHRLRDLIDEAKLLEDRPGSGLRLTAVHAGLWEELENLGVVTEQSERWTRSAGSLLALTEIPHPPTPAGLRAELRPYQIEGYQWLSLLWDLQLGGVLADDMGLGKTVQTLAMAARAAANGTLGGERGPLLIVTPTSVMSTWASQTAQFCPDLDLRVIGATERKSGRTVSELAGGADIVVTSFTLFRIDEAAYRSTRWCGLILDEAQFVKNHQAKTYQCARRLNAPFKLAITGTPLENSLMDLWSMLSITAPGLFPNPQKFNEFYRRPIEGGGHPERLDALRRRIRPLMLRRTKEHVAADLPPKTEQLLEVTLNPQHRRVYDTHLNRERQRVLRLVDDLDRNRISILQSLTTLRQLSLDASLVEPEHAGKIRSSKIDVLVEQLREIAAEGHRALVFSQFTRFLSLVRERLVEEGIGSCYLDGRTRDRAARIAEFTDGDDPVFLISLKAGGFGITLTEADYVYVLDPWWNPATEEQAIDRAHRIGQDKPVMVYRLVATDTIEEKVVALQQRKRDLFARVVDGGGASSSALTAADIREIFAV
jgi:superfamily II DNA or RNA helicase